MSAQPTDSVRKSPSNNLNRQLGLYSLAAAAAGVTMLALAQPAAGEVVITRKTIPIPLTCCGGVSIDMNHDGITDFKLYGTYFSFSGTSFHVEDSGVVGKFYASALARGAKVGPSAHFSSGTFARIERATGGYLNHKFKGYWGDNAKNRYLGVRFLIDGKTHYGWIRLTVTIPANPTHFMTATITGYAYETVPNKPILVGTAAGAVAGTAGKPTAEVQLPENIQNQSGPSLGMLALGAESLPLWRREQTPTSR
jgi:hypothetical protein